MDTINGLTLVFGLLPLFPIAIFALPGVKALCAHVPTVPHTKEGK